MGDVEAALSLAGAIALLAIWAIVMWWVCPWIGMPPNPTAIVRALIVLIALAYSLHDVIATYGGGSPSRASLGYGPTPSIMAPEKR